MMTLESMNLDEMANLSAQCAHDRKIQKQRLKHWHPRDPENPDWDECLEDDFAEEMGDE